MLPNFTHLSVDQRHLHKSRVCNRAPAPVAPKKMTPEREAQLKQNIEKLAADMKQEQMEPLFQPVYMAVPPLYNPKVNEEEMAKLQAEVKEQMEKLVRDVKETTAKKDYEKRVKASGAFQPGAFVIARIAREVYVAASVNAVNLDGNGGTRYDITTHDGVEIVNLHGSRLSVQPAYSAETFSEGFVYDPAVDTSGAIG